MKRLDPTSLSPSSSQKKEKPEFKEPCANKQGLSLSATLLPASLKNKIVSPEPLSISPMVKNLPLVPIEKICGNLSPQDAVALYKSDVFNNLKDFSIVFKNFQKREDFSTLLTLCEMACDQGIESLSENIASLSGEETIGLFKCVFEKLYKNISRAESHDVYHECFVSKKAPKDKKILILLNEKWPFLSKILRPGRRASEDRWNNLAQELVSFFGKNSVYAAMFYIMSLRFWENNIEGTKDFLTIYPKLDLTLETFETALLEIKNWPLYEGPCQSCDLFLEFPKRILHREDEKEQFKQFLEKYQPKAFNVNLESKNEELMINISRPLIRHPRTGNWIRQRHPRDS